MPRTLFKADFLSKSGGIKSDDQSLCCYFWANFTGRCRTNKPGKMLLITLHEFVLIGLSEQIHDG